MKIVDIIQEELDNQERDWKWLADKTNIKYSSLWYRGKNNILTGDDLARIGNVLKNIDLNRIKECVEMKELILKDVLELEENKYASFMTFEEYLSLIQNEIINLPNSKVNKSLNGSDKAMFYNDPDNKINEINDFSIALHVDINKSIIETNNKDIIIKSESFELIDGIYTTSIIQNLDNRFMKCPLKINVIVSSVSEAVKFISQIEKR